MENDPEPPLSEVIKQRLISALKRHRYQTQAALELGIDRKTLYRWRRKWNIRHAWTPPTPN